MSSCRDLSPELAAAPSLVFTQFTFIPQSLFKPAIILSHPLSRLMTLVLISLRKQKQSEAFPPTLTATFHFQLYFPFYCDAFSMNLSKVSPSDLSKSCFKRHYSCHGPFLLSILNTFLLNSFSMASIYTKIFFFTNASLKGIYYLVASQFFLCSFIIKSL